MGSVGAQQTMQIEPLSFRAPLTGNFRALRLTPAAEVRAWAGGGAHAPTTTLPIALIHNLEFRTAVRNAFWGWQGLKGRRGMVMDRKTCELRVDQHLNSVPGSFPNSHVTLDTSLVLSMSPFVFCVMGKVFNFFPPSFLAARCEGSGLWSCHRTTELNGSFVHGFLNHL